MLIIKITRVALYFIFCLLIFLVIIICCSNKQNNVAISTDGVPIHFSIQGEGSPAFVFIHGWSGRRTDWDAQINYFDQNHKVVLIDLAGFGESGNNREEWTMSAFANDVIAVINKLGLKESVLIGHSMGGPVILETAKRIPEKVIGLVPVDIFQNVEYKYSQEQIDRIVTRFMDSMKNPDEEQIRAILFSEDTDSALIKKAISERTLASKGWEESLREVFKWLSNDLTTTLKQIQVPICCINSDKIPTNVDIAQQYAPSFRVKIVPGVGHLGILWEKTETFNRILEEAIKEFQN